MTYDESEDNILLALTELDAIRNRLNDECKVTERVFDKFQKACEILECKGEIDSLKTPDNLCYYDSTNSVLTKYFVSKEEKSCYNNIFNMVNFLLNHQGNSEQFAIALALLFANSKNVRCYPVRVKVKLENNDDDAISFSFVNLVQIIADGGDLIKSFYIDIFNHIEPTITYTEVLRKLTDKLTNENQKCTYAEFDGINFFPIDIDLKKNFTIFESLTDIGGVDFNYDAYEFDYTNAETEKCTIPENYISKKELKEQIETYLK